MLLMMCSSDSVKQGADSPEPDAELDGDPLSDEDILELGPVSFVGVLKHSNMHASTLLKKAATSTVGATCKFLTALDPKRKGF